MNSALAKAITAVAATALVLGVAGCTDGPDGASPSGTSTQQVPVTVPGPGSPSATAPGATALGYLDAAALKAAVQQWANSTDGATVNDQQALRAALPQAEKWLEGITVLPATCGLYGLGNLKEQLDKSAMAASVLPPAVGGDLTVAAYPDRNALVADVAAQQHLDESCGTYTVTADGQTIASTLTQLQATSSAPYTAATMLQSVNGKKKSRTVSVRVIDGHIMLTASRPVKGTVESATAQALGDAESMLGILRGTTPAPAPAP